MAGFLKKLFGHPTIENPVLGILDLTAGAASETIDLDRSQLAGPFSSVVESRGAAPACSVLLIYCQLEDGGSIVGFSTGLRDLIRESGARIAIVATPNSPERYTAATQRRGYGHANLVLTLDRRGEAFGKFFSRLFADMRRGTSMPVAWVRLAPQIPNAEHTDCPDTIFLCEVGQITFG